MYKFCPEVFAFYRFAAPSLATVILRHLYKIMIFIITCISVITVYFIYKATKNDVDRSKNQPEAQVNKKLSSMRHSKIVIIGGGIGGVSAAWFLRKFIRDNNLSEKISVTVIEASDRIGGRCKTVEIENVVYESGATLISELNEYFKHFLKLIDGKKSTWASEASIPTFVIEGENKVEFEGVRNLGKA